MGAATKAKRTVIQFLSGLAIGLGVCLLAFLVLAYYYVTGMTTPQVRQSDGFVAPDAISETDFPVDSLPVTASEVRYCYSSVGLGGRLLLYRFSAPLTDLHQHARNDFTSERNDAEPVIEKEVTQPIAADTIDSYSKAYGVEADWMLPPPDAVGALYTDPEGTSHRPTIYIDEGNEVLYYYWTD